MTEEYVSELYSRISRLNYTNRIYVKRTVGAASICALALLCGYFLHFFFGNEEDIKPILFAHFCSFFEDLGPIECIRRTVDFAMTDIAPILLIMLFGYTMLSGILGKAVLIIYSVRLGWCGAFIYDLLITDGAISGSVSAFALFALCKLSILTALIFSVLRGEDFSYSFGEIFLKSRHPLTDRRSVEYLITMSSTAGFAAIINTIYLIFQSISGLVPL